LILYGCFITDYDEQLAHTSTIREHYMFLLETLDVKSSGLLSELLSGQVVTANEAEDINAEKTSFRANEKLLSVLSRKSPEQFQQFLDALDNCGQQHVRREIDNSNIGLSIFYCMVTFSDFSFFTFTDTYCIQVHNGVVIYI